MSFIAHVLDTVFLDIWYMSTSGLRTGGLVVYIFLYVQGFVVLTAIACNDMRSKFTW